MSNTTKFIIATTDIEKKGLWIWMQNQAQFCLYFFFNERDHEWLHGSEDDSKKKVEEIRFADTLVKSTSGPVYEWATIIPYTGDAYSARDILNFVKAGPASEPGIIRVGVDPMPNVERYYKNKLRDITLPVQVTGVSGLEWRHLATSRLPDFVALLKEIDKPVGETPAEAFLVDELNAVDTDVHGAALALLTGEGELLDSEVWESVVDYGNDAGTAITVLLQADAEGRFLPRRVPTILRAIHKLTCEIRAEATEGSLYASRDLTDERNATLLDEIIQTVRWNAETLQRRVRDLREERTPTMGYVYVIERIEALIDSVK